MTATFGARRNKSDPYRPSHLGHDAATASEGGIDVILSEPALVFQAVEVTLAPVGDPLSLF